MTETMRAVGIKGGKGDADALFIDKIPKPQPKDTDAIVKIKAFGLNRMDLLQREGMYPVPPQAPKTLGVEFSGIIESFGKAAEKDFKVGDEVFGLAYGGAYAEYIAVSTHMLLHKPKELSWEEAAGVPETWITATQAMYLVGEFAPKKSILWHAGASSVSIAGIQLSRADNASAIYVTAGSQEKIDFCVKELGATAGFNYHTQDWSKEILKATDGKGVDVIIDFVGQNYFQGNLDAAARDGHIVNLGAMSGTKLPAGVDIGAFVRKRLRFEGSSLRSRDEGYQGKLRNTLSDHALPKMRDGSFKIFVERIFPMEQIVEAHKLMETNKTKESKSPESSNVQKQASLLSKSAQGATFLILLQIGSRALTFIVNQILLRYLSPETLGVSTQLELYAISVLYFARESLRVALQRQWGDNGPAKETKGDEEGEKTSDPMAASYKPSQRAQEVVNLSYIAIGLGLPLAYILARLYVRSAETAVLLTPYIQDSLAIYALATFIELINEPCFAIAQQQMLYGTRASAETFATFTRCVVTCATAIWASRNGLNLGVLPFAIGQLSYASVLNIVYLVNISPVCTRNGFSLLLRPISSPNPHLLLSRFPLPLLTLALNLYAQSGLKHVLTTGDSILIAALTSLPSQGAYTLASNYGGLLARILFQPIEESSRSLFARLLHSQQLSSSVPTSTTKEDKDPSLTQATTYLRSLLHLYSLLSVLALSLGPTASPLLLRTIAGPRWSQTAAPAVLAAYCYYIPLLAVNGILEAFVSAIATPSQLRTQSAWMLAFSAAFAGTGFVVLGVWDLGARGLVLANAVNMLLRIWWSGRFVSGYLRGRGVGLGVGEMLPKMGTCVVGFVVAGGLRRLEEGFQGGVGDLVKWVGVAGGCGVSMLFFERAFFYECYRMLWPSWQDSNSTINATRKTI